MQVRVSQVRARFNLVPVYFHTNTLLIGGATLLGLMSRGQRRTTNSTARRRNSDVYCDGRATTTVSLPVAQVRPGF